MEKQMSTMDWLMEQSEQGRTLEIVWEGGGDSGWVHFEIDGENYENVYTEHLVEYMHEELDYGSWAGEFSASGRAEFNPKTKCFEGTDYYSEDETITIDTKIDVLIPDDLWFDSVSLNLDGNYDEDVICEARFTIKNGFMTSKHEDCLSQLEKVISEKANKEILNYLNTTSSDIRGCWDNFRIPFSEFNKDDNPGFLTHTILELSVGILNENDKPVCLDLNEENCSWVNNPVNEKGEIEDETV
jgi:hypothetical protein